MMFNRFVVTILERVEVADREVRIIGSQFCSDMAEPEGFEPSIRLFNRITV